jgi:phosphatidate cytidylyltransferase
MSETAPAPAAPPATPAPLSKANVFARRLLSTVFLWGVVLGALFSGIRFIEDYVVLLLMTVLAGFGLGEFYSLVEKEGMVCFKRWGVVAGVLLMAGTFFHLTGKLGTSGTPARVNDFEVMFLILFVLGLCLLQFFSRTNTKGILAISTTLFGLMYVPWLLNFVQKIHFFQFPPKLFPDAPAGCGKFYVLYFILVTKFSDSGAYAVGSLIGRHKMIPRISPGKTWEGFGGAILVSTGASVLFAHVAGARLPGMSVYHAIVLGILLSVAAVVGDLIESIFKREAGVKDSGKFFPGIGGVLDLLDSLLFNAPLMYLYLRHVLTNPALH